MFVRQCFRVWVQGSPDVAGEFTGHGDDDLGERFASGTHAHVSVVQAFLGGRSNECADFDSDLALDPSGDAVIMSWTASPDFPTTPGAYDRSLDGSYDCFVAKVKPRRTSSAEPFALGDPVTRPAAPGAGPAPHEQVPASAPLRVPGLESELGLAVHGLAAVSALR